MKELDFKIGEIYEVAFKDIKLRERLHRNNMSLDCKLKDIIKKNKFNHFDKIILPVRVTEHGNIILLAGRKSYEIMRFGQQANVKVKIFASCDRFNYLKSQKHYQSVKLEDIVIKDIFKATTPSYEKLDRQRKHFSETCEFTEAIILNRIDGKIVLKDGYSRYIVAKELELKEIDVIFI